MKKTETAWVVVYISDRRERAAEIQTLLQDEGFLTRMHPDDAQSRTGTFEILCIPSEARQARTLLDEKGLA